MAYQCPTCGGPAERGSGRVAQQAAGLVGLLLYSAFAGFHCTKCGKLECSSFPPEVRSKMTRNSALMVGGALVLLVAIIALMAALN